MAPGHAFFVIGSQANAHRDILKRMSDEGHEIGVFTWSHPALTTLSTDQVVAELQWTMQIIQEVTGKTPKYFRPPYSDYDYFRGCFK